MPNPNPKIENLTRAGLGRPRKELKAVLVPLSPELLERLAEIQAQQDWPRNYLIEQVLRAFLEMPSDYDADDFALIIKGATVE